MWNLDTMTNTGTINFKLPVADAGTISDTPCMEAVDGVDVDNSVGYTCNGAGYMYCADWGLNGNTEFIVGKGAADESAAPTCSSFMSPSGVTCAVCFTAA
jgi:hypothetical protein